MDRPRRLEGLGRATLRWAIAAYVLAMTGFAHSAGSSPTLTAVKARGSLVCGVNEGLPGFSNVDERGVWTGFDVDFCRAIAAAIFGDPKKVKLVPLSADARFQALRDGKIDVLARNSTWTMGRETEFGLTFVGVTYYDGQGFMVPRALRVNSALQLDGAKVCVQSGTTTIDNLADFFTSNGMTLQEVVSASTDEVDQKLRRRPLLGPDQRSFPALCVASPPRQAKGPSDSAGRDLEGAARARWCATMTCNGSVSCGGSISP